jgi:hypothetical protein
LLKFTVLTLKLNSDLFNPINPIFLQAKNRIVPNRFLLNR